MSGASDRWSDLMPRVLSALVMLALGGGAIWAGGGAFALLAVFCCGVMLWELAKMTRGTGFDASLLIGLLAAAAAAANLWSQHSWVMILLLLPTLLGLVTPRRDIIAFVPYSLLIVVTCLILVVLRNSHGALVVLWLISVVVASDVMGYFAGRVLGGPKFWPAISPKKTWSGTVAGWLGAFLVGGLFWALGGWSVIFLVVSPLVAFAGQMGDIAESAIKRRAGVKDASNIIPGHGGLLDRFDALLFAGFVTFLLQLLLNFLPVTKG